MEANVKLIGKEFYPQDYGNHTRLKHKTNTD